MKYLTNFSLFWSTNLESISRLNDFCWIMLDLMNIKRFPIYLASQTWLYCT